MRAEKRSLPFSCRVASMQHLSEYIQLVLIYTPLAGREGVVAYISDGGLISVTPNM